MNVYRPTYDTRTEVNLFLTIIIAGLIGTGTAPTIPVDIETPPNSIPSRELLYSVEAKDNAQNIMKPEIWDQILSGMAGSGNAEFIDVYLITGNDLSKAVKLVRFPFHDHSYSMNVPPASQVLYVGKRTRNGIPVYSVNGVVNKQNSWVYISTVVQEGQVNLLKQDENKVFSSLQSQ